MAKDPSKTEKPTQKKITETREDGNVMQSQDVTSVVVLIGATAVIAMMLGQMFNAYGEALKVVMEQMRPRDEWDAVKIKFGAQYAIGFLARVLIPILLVVSICSMVATRAQVGHFFSFKPLQWKFDKLNPVNGMKQVLPNVKNTMKLLFVMAKVFVVGVLVYTMLRENLAAIIALPTLELFEALEWIFIKLVTLTAKILAFYIAIAVVDYIYKRYDYFENLKMSKQEVKDEKKNAEGDPVMKGKIRQKMMQISMMRMIQELPNADVVVTNPTHVAVALKYTPGQFAPRVVAKGLRKRAQKIKEIARKHDVPIVEAPPLARSLFRNTKLGGFIPEFLFAAVAAILAKIHARRRRRQIPIQENETQEAMA